MKARKQKQGWRWLAVAVLLVGLVGTGAGCERARELWPGERPNVLLITMDTTRADHLGCYGYQNIETPVLDRLAAEGVRFERVYASAPITLPSHATILTGTYTLFHGARNNGTYRVDDSLTTAAEIFKNKGYRTAAFIASFPLLGRFGLDQGFEVYDDRIEEGKEKRQFLFQERRAEDVNAVAIQWLKTHARGPFFMWVHYFDPHFSYEPPSPFRERYFTRPYDGEIAYTDSQIGKLLEAFRAQGVLDHTIVAVTADHGESLGEHKEKTHAMLIYYGTVQVPLILWSPRVLGPPRVVSDLVRTVDILPTLLDYTRISAPREIQGVSLRPLIEGKTQSLNLVAYTETMAPYLHFHWSPLEGIRTNQYLFIQAEPEELYDLRQDPKEINDLAGQEPKRVAELRELWQNTRQAIENPNPPEAEIKLDQETKERLEALGYVFSLNQPPRPEEKLKNPRQGVEILEEFFAGQSMIAREDYARAHLIFDDILRKDPEFGVAYLKKGQVYARQKNCEAALKYYALAEPLLVEQVELYFNRGQCYAQLKDYAQAEKNFLEGIRLDPSNALAYILLARIRFIQKKPQEGYQFLVQGVEANPKSEVAHFELGKFLRLNGKIIEAKNEFLQSQEANPNFAPAAYELAKLQYETGEKERAVENLEECLRRDPKFVAAHALLAQIFLDEDAFQKASAHIDIALALNPDSDDARFAHGNLLVKQGKFPDAFAEFQKTIALNPKHPLAHKNLGALFAIQGNAAQAIEHYRISLELLPNQPNADKIREAIADLEKSGAPSRPGKVKR